VTLIKAFITEFVFSAAFCGMYSRRRFSPQFQIPTTITPEISPASIMRTIASSMPQSTPPYAVDGSKRFCPSCM
jgi:hypothetical protein